MFESTPWIDLAWLGDQSQCQSIKENSYNQNPKYRCVFSGEKDHGKEINEDECKSADGSWVEFTSFLEILDGIDNEADCKAASGKDSRNKIIWGKTRVSTAKTTINKKLHL